MALYAILKIARPDGSQLGLDAAATTLFFFVKAGFYVCVYCIQPALIATIAQGTTGTRVIVLRTKRTSAVLSTMGVVASAYPFITLFASNGRDTTAVVVFYLFFGTTVLHVTGLGLQAWDTKRAIIAVLDKSLALQPSDTTIEVKDKLVALQRSAILQSSTQVILWLAFIVLSPLALRYDYTVPVVWVTLSILGKRLAETTVVDHKRYKKGGTGNTGQSNDGSFNNGSSLAMTSRGASFAKPDQPSSVIASTAVQPPTSEHESFGAALPPITPPPQAPR